MTAGLRFRRQCARQRRIRSAAPVWDASTLRYRRESSSRNSDTPLTSPKPSAALAANSFRPRTRTGCRDRGSKGLSSQYNSLPGDQHRLHRANCETSQPLVCAQPACASKARKDSPCNFRFCSILRATSADLASMLESYSLMAQILRNCFTNKYRKEERNRQTPVQDISDAGAGPFDQNLNPVNTGINLCKSARIQHLQAFGLIGMETTP